MGWTRPSFEAVGVNIDALYMKVLTLFAFADIFKHRQSFASSTYEVFCAACSKGVWSVWLVVFS